MNNINGIDFVFVIVLLALSAWIAVGIWRFRRPSRFWKGVISFFFALAFVFMLVRVINITKANLQQQIRAQTTRVVN